MARNTARVRDKQIGRQAKLLAPKAWDVANAAGKKINGAGFSQPWNDSRGEERYVKARQAGWIAGIEYALNEFLRQCPSSRATKTSAPKRKRK